MMLNESEVLHQIRRPAVGVGRILCPQQEGRSYAGSPHHTDRNNGAKEYAKQQPWRCAMLMR